MRSAKRAIPVLLGLVLLVPTLALAQPQGKQNQQTPTLGNQGAGNAGGLSAPTMAERLQARYEKRAEQERKAKAGVERAVERFCMKQNLDSNYHICNTTDLFEGDNTKR